MKRTRKELEERLATLENELVSIRTDLRSLAEKGRGAVRRGKDSRDQKQLDKVRKDLGL